MSGRRSSRSDTLPSATGLLDQIAPAHHALNMAKASVKISGPVYASLEAATEALDRLAIELGHPRRFVGQPPRANLP